MATTVPTNYPSVPIPTDDIDSIYQSVLAMRQTVQLLIVNAQQVTNQTLTKASQTFSKKSDHADLTATVNNNLATVNKTVANLSQTVASLSQSVSTLQNQSGGSNAQVTTLQSDVSTLQGQVSTINSEISIMQSQINTINANLARYLLLAGGTMTGDLDFNEASGINAVVGKNTSGTRWTVHIGDSFDEFSVTDAAGTPLLWCKQDGSIHVASAIVVGAHP